MAAPYFELNFFPFKPEKRLNEVLVREKRLFSLHSFFGIALKKKFSRATIPDLDINQKQQLPLTKSTITDIRKSVTKWIENKLVLIKVSYQTYSI